MVFAGGAIDPAWEPAHGGDLPRYLSNVAPGDRFDGPVPCGPCGPCACAGVADRGDGRPAVDGVVPGTTRTATDRDRFTVSRFTVSIP